MRLAALIFDRASRLRRWSEAYAGGVGLNGFAMIPGPRTPHPVDLATVFNIAALYGVDAASMPEIVDDVIAFDEEFRRRKNADAAAHLKKINAR